MLNNSDPQAIFLMGPTASGKTDLAIEIASRIPCDVISVDSALIYRGMDIGTAKPTADELAQAPHGLIDILDPSESYSAADFRVDAIALMDKAVANGRVPLLVGGTMLYFKALLEGLSPLPQADAQIRAQIETEAQTLGWSVLHDQLKEIDPVAAQRIHPNDPQRLSRALEVFRITGKTLTELTQQKAPPLPYKVHQFALMSDDRHTLHQRIETRFMKMLEAGFEQEVRALKHREDLNLDLPSMRSVGYRQMWQYLDGELSYEEMVYRGVVATRQLAKRQITWLRGWQDLVVLEPGARDNIDKIVQVIG